MSKFTLICEDDPCPFGGSITTKRTFEFDAIELEGIVGEFVPLFTLSFPDKNIPVPSIVN